jgi:hypothetical protein
VWSKKLFGVAASGFSPEVDLRALPNCQKVLGEKRMKVEIFQ